MNYIICSYKIDEEIEYNLKKSGVIPIKLRGLESFAGNYPFNPIIYHPDMFCFNLTGNKWIFYEEVYKINKDIIDNLNLDVITQKNPKSCDYPHDVGLNAAMFGDNLICNTKYINPEILKFAKQTGKNIINVKQGYTKCSVCIVDENSVITFDLSIYEKAKENNIDALLTVKGNINLDGYDYGFIGGCSGLINTNILAFTGDIKLHPDYENIKSFCDKRGVKIVSLSHKKLYDYGSLFKIEV